MPKAWLQMERLKYSYFVMALQERERGVVDYWYLEAAPLVLDPPNSPPLPFPANPHAVVRVF